MCNISYSSLFSVSRFSHVIDWARQEFKYFNIFPLLRIDLIYHLLLAFFYFIITVTVFIDIKYVTKHINRSSELWV